MSLFKPKVPKLPEVPSYSQADYETQQRYLQRQRRVKLAGRSAHNVSQLIRGRYGGVTYGLTDREQPSGFPRV